ncbi:PQQ-dependent sugar dehydrogenase [Rhodobacteraceae bacterium M382]|nr:PQQ-dependent sugar dehydrogenase [Rhodobacteraceae bacterium M382]
MYRVLRGFLICLVIAGGAMPSRPVAQTSVLPSSQGALAIEAMLTGLDTPWAVGFLPAGEYLVTERDGNLLLVREGKSNVVKGVPRVKAQGQGGLLDVLVPRDFASSGQIFLTFSKHQKGGAGTAVVVGHLDTARARLTQTRIIFEAAPSSGTGRHFGSRIAEAPDGTLFVTIGDRGQPPSAQDLSRQQGSIIRINRDGSIPDSNPFVNTAAARPEIWSYGHRNPQGMALSSDGSLWAVEHGARGGDEVNRIHKGANYGWPVIAYGRHYSGGKIGEGTHKTGLQQPDFYWDPSIAPSGMMIYSGRLWPQWRGHMFVGSLKFDYIARLAGSRLREREQLVSRETERVRDIREAPDGSIWFISVGNGAIYRIAPGP